MDQGDTLAIVGPSGSGKSTLMNILGCLDSPTSGAYLIGDTSPLELNRRKTARFRRDYIGFVFRDHFLLPQLSVLENVLIPCLATGLPLKTDVGFAKKLLEQLNLSGCSDSLPALLTNEQKQRTAIARAMIKRPSLLLADEPGGKLSDKTGEEIINCLLRLQKEYGSMLILATDGIDNAKKMGRIGFLRQGRLFLSAKQFSQSDDTFDASSQKSPEASQPLSLGWEEPESEPEDIIDESSTNAIDEFRRRFQ